MSILKDNNFAVKKEMLLEKQESKSPKLSLSPCNSKLLAQIGATANKTSCVKERITPGDKAEFSELGKCNYFLA